MENRFDEFMVDVNILLKKHKVKLIINIDETISVMDDNDNHKWLQSVVFKDELEREC